MSCRKRVVDRDDIPFDIDTPEGMYWQFHWGIAPCGEHEAFGPDGMPPRVAQLGQLVEIKLARGDSYEPPPSVEAAITTDKAGRRLYVVSDEPLDLRGVIRGGEIEAIAYRTYKAGDGDTVYEHAFEGQRPALGFDSTGHPVIRRNGSDYHVTWRGIEE